MVVDSIVETGIGILVLIILAIAVMIPIFIDLSNQDISTTDISDEEWFGVVNVSTALAFNPVSEVSFVGANTSVAQENLTRAVGNSTKSFPSTSTPVRLTGGNATVDISYNMTILNETVNVSLNGVQIGTLSNFSDIPEHNVTLNYSPALLGTQPVFSFGAEESNNYVIANASLDYLYFAPYTNYTLLSEEGTITTGDTNTFQIDYTAAERFSGTLSVLVNTLAILAAIVILVWVASMVTW